MPYMLHTMTNYANGREVEETFGPMSMPELTSTIEWIVERENVTSAVFTVTVTEGDSEG